ncbi:thymidylate synthase [Alteromonas australica]|uniref:thymidylate synthase n=1 Tax=Alteromonas australica TaxID=589873 RepID=UPI003F6710D6
MELGLKMEIHGESIDELIRASLCLLFSQGKENTPTKGKNLELTGVLLTLSNPLNRISRTETKNTLFSCLGELFWYLSGSDNVDHMIYYLSNYSRYAESDGTVGGAYGPRLLGTHNSVNQLENVISILEQKPSSRQAVIQIFDKYDLVNRKNDIPCTQTLQFILRDNLLELIVTMRSNDVFRGLPHDIFCFTMLQELVAKELSVRFGKEICLGNYKHFVGSFHVYEEDFEHVESYQQEGYPSIQPIMTSMPLESYRLLNGVVKMEKKIRESQQSGAFESEFPNYWSDLTMLLLIFNTYKQNSTNSLLRIKQLMANLTNKGYKPVVQKLLDKLGNKNDK